MGLNGGLHFKFNVAFSFVVECVPQEEIDFYWHALLLGGQESMCGWLKDKYGASWQIVPANLCKLTEDPERAQRVMAAVMKMKKLDILKLMDA